MKSGRTHWGASSTWHHRLLGGLWALCGFGGVAIAVGNLARTGGWDDYRFWLASAVAFSYVVAGIGFIFGRTWARRTMAALMVIAALFFLDMLLMFGFHGNWAGIWGNLVVLGIVAYTLGFLLISALAHCQ